MLIGTSRYKFYASDIREMIVISSVKHKSRAVRKRERERERGVM